MGFLFIGAIVSVLICESFNLFDKKLFFTVQLIWIIGIFALSLFVPFGESKGMGFDSRYNLVAVVIDGEECYIEHLSDGDIKCITMITDGVDYLGNPIIATREYVMPESRTRIVRDSDVENPTLVVNKEKWSGAFWSFYAHIKNNTSYYVIYLPD